MLAYILAVLVGTSSVGLYLWAFLFPEIHRKQDFIWSGVGLFYALFLWLYARQVTGGILVGQTTSVALLGWFGWETFKLRRQLVPSERASNTDPNAISRQQPSDSRRATPATVKQTQKTPAISPTTPIEPQSPPAATPERPRSGQTPVANSIPLERVKVPPVTSDRATPSGAKVTPPEPPPMPIDSSPISVTPPPPSIDPSPVTADEAWIKLEIKPAPAKPLGTPAQPPITINPASPPVKLIAGAEITPDLPERSSEATTIASEAKDKQ